MVANGRQTLYTYDAWGRTTGTFTGVEEWEYEYRFGNYLKRAERYEAGASQERVAYLNDGNGKRRLRTLFDTSGGGAGVKTEETWYRWAGLVELGEYEQGGGGFWDIGTKTLSHIPGLGAVAGASQATGDYRHYLTDHLGSTRSILDGAKAPLARYAYTPYGQPTVNVGLALNVGYTGHAWDNVTQQWFAPYRYYDPSNARWLWRDPLGFVDGPNMYGYVGGSPIMLIDPLGLSQVFGPSPAGEFCNGALDGAMQLVDTFNPFGDPLEQYYDPNDAGMREGKVGGEIATWALPAGGGLKIFRLVRRAKEPTIRGIRIAPFGNDTKYPHPKGKWPHYHRKKVDANGNTIPGQREKRHRPWDKHHCDTSFWDRF